MAKLTRRGGIWYAWIPAAGGGVRRVSTNCTDKEAARLRQKVMEREGADPDSAAAAKALTGDLLEAIVKSTVRKGRSKATVSFVKQKSGQLLRLLPERAAQLTHARLESYVDARIKEGVTTSTIRKELGVLRGALRLARRNGLFPRDPASVLPDVEDSYKPKTRALSPFEVVSLCGWLERDRAAHVAFIVATAARWGESLRARRDDVSEDFRFVFLRGTKTVAARRTAAIAPVFRKMLSWALEGAPGGMVDEGLLFTLWSNVRRDLHVACVNAGIEPCSPNDLRRTHATWLRAAGVEPHLIGVQLGHTTSRMAEQVYGRLSPEALGKLLEESARKDIL